MITPPKIVSLLLILSCTACFSDPSEVGGASSGDDGSSRGAPTTGAPESSSSETTSDDDSSSTGFLFGSSTTGVWPGTTDGSGTSTGSDVDTDAEPVCGNAEIEGEEECDDGNAVANDGCESTCVTSGIAQVSVGRTHVCALTRAGTVRCFGQSTHGELGYGDLETIGDDEHPYEAGDVDIGDTPAVYVGAGIRHTCALLEDGTVKCWGDSQSGRLGYSVGEDIGDDEAPGSVGVVILGGTVEQLAVGDQHNCAVLEGGTLRCWGLNFEGNVLGYGDIGNVGDDEIPSSVGDVFFGKETLIAQVSAGFTHTCALSTLDEVFCWGNNENGKLGIGSVDPLSMPSPTAVQLGGDARAVLAGTVTSCALMSDDDVYCWGRGSFHTLGTQNTDDIGDDEPANAAGEIPLGFNAQQVVGRGFHHCALSDAGGVHCWGSPNFGRLGYGELANIGDDEDPADAPAVSVGGSVVQISADIESTCALRDDHEVVCWGRNDDGRIGIPGGENIGDDELPSSVGPVQILSGR